MNLNLKEKIKFQDLFYYNSLIKNELEIKIKEIIKKSSFIKGADNAEFEENFANSFH